MASRDINTSSNFTKTGISQPVIINFSFGLAGCILNGLVCLIIATHKSLRQPFNHLILNLSLSDFFVSLSVILYGLSNYLAVYQSANNLSITVADILCKLDVFCILASISAACLTLSIISIERYQAIAILRLHKMKLSTTRKIILIIWILASIPAAIPAYFSRIDANLYHSCHLNQMDNFFLTVFCVILFCLTCFLPVIFMLLLYGIITHKLWITTRITPSTVSQVASKRKRYLRRSVIAILGISLFSSGTALPYLVFSIILIIGQHYDSEFKLIFIAKNELIWSISTYLFILTPILNPLLYNLASSQFREVLYHLLNSHDCKFLARTRRRTNTVPIQRTTTIRTLTTKPSHQLTAVD
ncbi:Tachykinin-like peptides receptor 86C [Trichoplax sp. H2]|nr:Tachykinin-like peptides receptor 86C [Trichoplax sp. H2]|eukprot:RDD41499.1 Tachykinin-like peptides receptor 86C [Trichoplax sp. H2]